MSMEDSIQFTVVMTTHKRPELARRAVESVVAQTFTDWSMVVINDSPSEDYESFELFVSGDPRINYLKNKVNCGKNKSVNRALQLLDTTNKNSYVLFLDDDDWFAPAALQNFYNEIYKKDRPWLVADRAFKNGDTLTKNYTQKEVVSYLTDVLIMRNFKGDTTHCIQATILVTCRFPETIPNGEEWVFWLELNKKTSGFYYMPFSATYTDGYLQDGLSRKKTHLSVQIHEYIKCMQILHTRNILGVLVSVYLILRLGRIVSGAIFPKRYLF